MTPRHAVIIIGAGGAGLLAAWRTTTHNVPTLLLERNRKAGIKILISGGGKCNVTHAGSVEELLRAFPAQQSRFLKHALFRFSNNDLIVLLHQHGVPTYTRPNGRVFPASNDADDVVHVLKRIVQAPGTELRFHATVDNLVVQEGRVVGVQCGNVTIPATHVVVATGGVSYPKTGSTGDGYRWAANAGHTVVPPSPALAPIGVDPPLPHEWRGIALRRGRLSIVQEKRTIAHHADDLLFSHEGLTGPAALELSNAAYRAGTGSPAELHFDFFPDEDFDALDSRLLTTVEEERLRTIGNLLNAWLPNRIVDPLLHTIDVSPSIRGHALTREMRRKIVHLLKGWMIGRVGHIDITRGEVTAGGISLAEVDPRTMRSTRVRGLYLCGEVLDVAGPVGGYNLQAAFSTGYVAGETAARDWRGQSD